MYLYTPRIMRIMCPQEESVVHKTEHQQPDELRVYTKTGMVFTRSEILSFSVDPEPCVFPPVSISVNQLKEDVMSVPIPRPVYLGFSWQSENMLKIRGDVGTMGRSNQC
jgi:hypothetical protein